MEKSGIAGPADASMKAKAKVRKAASWPRSWANFSLFNCIPTGMRGQTCTVWANLTPFPLKAVVAAAEASGGGTLDRNEFFKLVMANTTSTRAASFRAGDIAAWLKSDADVPAGSEGVVLGFKANGRAYRVVALYRHPSAL